MISNTSYSNKVNSDCFFQKTNDKSQRRESGVFVTDKIPRQKPFACFKHFLISYLDILAWSVRENLSICCYQLQSVDNTTHNSYVTASVIGSNLLCNCKLYELVITVKDASNNINVQGQPQEEGIKQNRDYKYYRSNQEIQKLSLLFLSNQIQKHTKNV